MDNAGMALLTSILDVTTLAADLVRIPSANPMGRVDVELAPPFGEVAVALHVAEILRSLGGEVSVTEVTPGRPNVQGWFDFGCDETIIMEAHLDTVPTDGMTIPPFGGEVRDGRLWGRGACDVKGPMAAMICAIGHAVQVANRPREAPSDHPLPRYNVLFAAVCDEEYSFAGVRYLTEELRTAPSRSSRMAFAVVAEPTDLEPVIAHKGVVRWEATADGVAAHASLPERGKNAIYAMARGIAALERYASDLRERTPHPLLGAPSLSVGTIRGGSAVNVVPDFCTIQIDRRLIPGETPEAATAEVRSLLVPLGLRLSDPVMAAPSFETSADGPAAQACLAAAGRTGNSTAETRHANYCTDASFYAHCDLPAVVFGPGSIAMAHTADEWIAVDQLEAGVAAYLALLV